ncbi:MAG: phosphotransferase, partial [Gammaproteobacteria bacterium]|nr:phosphotransferase [Gammaproteobacteria bacterium]
MIKVCAARYNHDVKEIYLVKKVHAWCLKALGIANDQLTAVHPLRVEASHRSFYRLVTQSGSWVLMVSPPELEKNDQFLRIAKLFSSHHLPVPTQISHDTALGCFLMNDLGETHLAQTYTTPAQPAAMTTAINAIHDIAVIQHPDLPNYSQTQFFNELDLFNQWFLQGLLQTNPAREDYAESFQRLVAAAQEQPQGCIHMDYHSRNLLYNEGTLGIVDFQDARRGPRLYDIASLLHDCYYEFPA